MGKPRLIILIRHGQSEGNKNREIHQTTPDHRVKLTPEGRKQAEEAGRKLRTLLRPDDTLHFYTSPYRRTRETTEGILSSLTSSDPSPSPFPRQTIKVYEEPRLREQDFGNFQPGSTEMARMWHERAAYGHFFYRIPNGESAADAYDRISGFNESLWRSFGEDDFASVCVLVTHGLMTRVFLMKWYHFSVEYFEDLRNMNHCEFVVMKRSAENGKYVLQNQLRTWSELKREREEEREAERAEQQQQQQQLHSPIPVRKTWGGSRDKCDDGISILARRQARRQNTADLFTDESLPVSPSFQTQPGTSQPQNGDLTRRISNRQLRAGAKDKPRNQSPSRPQHRRSSLDHGGSTRVSRSRPNSMSFPDNVSPTGPHSSKDHPPRPPLSPDSSSDKFEPIADTSNTNLADSSLTHIQTSATANTHQSSTRNGTSKHSTHHHHQQQIHHHNSHNRTGSTPRIDVLRVGRDGGGSESGQASTSESEEEVKTGPNGLRELRIETAEIRARREKKKIRQPRSMAMALNRAFDEMGLAAVAKGSGDGSAVGNGNGTAGNGVNGGGGSAGWVSGEGVEARADALGDQSDMDDEDGDAVVVIKGNAVAKKEEV
ncbi:hypothetical protein MMC25_006326 [Agyrium rufum]|nr:hypothetical protein [Agyrium rufum]